jgi:hypothetical protein
MQATLWGADEPAAGAGADVEEDFEARAAVVPFCPRTAGRQINAPNNPAAAVAAMIVFFTCELLQGRKGPNTKGSNWRKGPSGNRAKTVNRNAIQPRLDACPPSGCDYTGYGKMSELNLRVSEREVEGGYMAENEKAVKSEICESVEKSPSSRWNLT